MPLTRRQLLERWWLLPVGATLGAFGYMGWYAARVRFGKRQPGEPAYQAATPVKVAATDDLSTDWASRNFTYAGRPCVLLRLPAPTRGSIQAGSAHYAAFSRVCTHLGCSVNVQRDLEVLAFSFNYRSKHPVLGCPCHYSVFDPLQDGEAVFGKALEPLPRVRLERRGAELWASGIEPAPKLG